MGIASVLEQVAQTGRLADHRRDARGRWAWLP